MARADGKVFELLADAICRELLRLLLNSDVPLTQRDLTAALGLNASTISRRMKDLEAFGLVERQSRNAPYDIPFPSETRDLLWAAARIARMAMDRQADEAREYERQLHKEGLDGGFLRDRARGA
jgi:DNA-binding IclR family transcriptional regulator